jgi:uncharacterized protein (TIGR02757 family)
LSTAFFFNTKGLRKSFKMEVLKDGHPLYSGDIKVFLDHQHDLYNNTDFIENDPISIPKQYSKKEDIEISAFITSMLAWGQRKTIINKSNELFALMEGAPFDFILNHKEKDRSRFSDFKHRTFNFTDTLYFIEFLQQHYRKHASLEDAFLINGKCDSVREGLIHFNQQFFSLPFAPKRTQKHIATPARKSTCKRLNMFLRWMVRKDDRAVDFGIWNRISPDQLMIPLDVHVGRVSRHFGLLDRKQNDWKAVESLTETLAKFCPSDPVKYDYSLFSLGVDKKF